MQRKGMAVLLFFSYMLGICFQYGVGAEERPEQVFFGWNRAQNVILNIDFNDLKDGNPWPQEAVYTAGALGIMKGYGNQNFGRYNALTKEQALSLAYRIAGREAEAQAAAEALPSNALPANQGRTPERYWADGYLSLGVNDGFLSQQDFLILTNQVPPDPLNPNPAPLSFVREAPATREEFAYYIAKLLQFPGSRGQEKLFNQFNDWDQTDPEKIPYVEDLLTRGILHGDGNGNLRPKDPLTREQAAAIIKNTVDYLPQTMITQRYFGVVEKIKDTEDMTFPRRMLKRDIDIRNSDGKLHRLQLEFTRSNDAPGKNELTGNDVISEDKNLVVYKDGKLGDSQLLSERDKIAYIPDPENTVKFVKVISNQGAERYVIGQFEQLDSEAGTLEMKKIVEMEFPQTSLEMDTLDGQENLASEKYRFKKDVPVYMHGIKSSLDQVYPQQIYLFTLAGDMITEIKNIKFSSRGKENTIVSGVVEDVNPSLKYLSVYDESGLTPIAAYQTRKFEILKPEKIQILKNDKIVSLDQIDPGDRVFVQLDQQKNVVSMSAVSHYSKKIGKVLSVNNGIMSIEYEDKSQQLFTLKADIPVFENGIKRDQQAIEAGERVRLLLRETPSQDILKEITLEGKENLITNIYKGLLWQYEAEKNAITAEYVEVLSPEGFVRIPQRGFKSFEMDKDAEVFKQNASIDLSDLNPSDKGKIFYLAVKKNYKGEEVGVFFALKDTLESERFLLKNPISYEANNITAFYQNGYRMEMRNDTLAVKKGRLVKVQNILDEDAATLVLNKNFNTSKNYAGIVKVDGEIPKTLEVYRARVSEIQEEKSFTVPSYSKWDLTTHQWQYSGVAKVFELTPASRLLSGEGILNPTNFKDYGEASYKDKYIYVLSNGISALEMNEMDFASDYLRGKIYDILPEQDLLSSEPAPQEPTSMKLRDVTLYDASNLAWNAGTETEINFEKNTIFIKQDQRVGVQALQKGDSVRVIKKDNKGLIIFVENR